MKIKFTGRGGYPFEVENAKEVLTINEYYEIEHVLVDRFSTEVYLKGLKYPFNSCLFEEDENWIKVFQNWETDGTFEIKQKYVTFIKPVIKE